ncbi:MAG: DMT family transporter [Verrucomicrobiales bacterium]
MTAHPDESQQARGLWLMVLSIVSFAANALLVRGVALHFPEADSWLISFFRGLAGLALVFSLYGGGRGLHPKHLLQRPKLVLRGILGALGIYLFYLTVIHLGVSRAVVLNLTYPIFAALMAAFFLGERLSRRKLVWTFVGFGGLALFLGEKAWAEGLSAYDGLALLGALIAAGVVVLIRSLHQSEHSSTIYASQCLYASLLAFPFSYGELPETSLPLVGWLVAAGFLVTCGQLAMTFSYRHLDVSTGASLQMTLPILTALGGYAFFGERFSGSELAGAALTLFATYQVARNRQKTKPPVKQVLRGQF